MVWYSHLLKNFPQFRYDLNKISDKYAVQVMNKFKGLDLVNSVPEELWKILQEMGITDHLTCLLRNLYVGQEATVITRQEIIDWFNIGKGLRQGCILSPSLFNLYAEYIMRNAELDEAQTGIKISGRNMNKICR